MTKPFLFRSKGLDAFWGEEYLSESARISTNPTNPEKLRLDSHPPAIIASALPSLTIPSASPIACAPAAQAETVVRLLPLQLNIIDRIEVATSGFLRKKLKKEYMPFFVRPL